MALSVDDKKSIKEYVNICIKEYIDLLRSEKDISINKTYDVKYYRKKVEKYLYMYPHLKQNIISREIDIINLNKENFETYPAVHKINTNGLVLTIEDKRKAITRKIQKDIDNDKLLIKRIEKALQTIKDDKYYKIISLFYFDNMKIDDISACLYCDNATVYRNKKRLIDKLIVILFGVAL